MTELYETCRNNLESLTNWFNLNKANRNEATTRFHLVDELFFNCLGWTKEDVVLEDPYDGDYTDYTFHAPRNVLIVEAKKQSDYFELPAGSTKINRSIPNLFRDYKSLKSAVEQATEYCQKRGVPFGAVTNGHQIVAFVATRSDGNAPLLGRALVFDSLDAMLNNFLEFWQALSKPAIERQLLRKTLIGEIPEGIPPKLLESIPNYPGSKLRNMFQTDLEVLSDLVIEDVINSEDLRSTFLRECYVQSGALSQYALVSKNILQARYSALFAPDRKGPTTTPVFEKKGTITPELIAKSLSRRPILLIGDVGVGKSTFIQYLIHVEAAPLFENSITILLNLGASATLTTDLKEFVLTDIVNQLQNKYKINIYEGEFVRDVYRSELENFKKGIFASYQESNPNEFLREEINFLKEKIEKKEIYLKDALKRISSTRRKQIILFLDNVDQRDEKTQQELFLISQEIAEHWSPVTVFITLRPETFYRSTKLGAASGYHPKAFTILPPRIDQVIDHRLNFAKKVTEGELPLSLITDIEVNLKVLGELISVFQYSLRVNNDIGECIENISGGNVRLALDLVRSFFGSGHIDTYKIVDKYQNNGKYTIPLHEFLRAVIYGDSEFYYPDKSPVANIFDVKSNDAKEHFLLPLILGALFYLSKVEAEQGFVKTSSIYEKIQALGFLPEQIDTALVRGYNAKLLEAAAGRIPQPGVQMPQTLRITTVGAYHILRLCELFPYIDAMIVDTPVLNEHIRGDIHNETSIEKRLDRATLFRQYLDESWNPVIELGGAAFFDWVRASKILEGNIKNVRSRIIASSF